MSFDSFGYLWVLAKPWSISQTLCPSPCSWAMAPPFENYPHSGGCRCFCKRSFSSVTPNKLSKVAFTCLQIVVGHRYAHRDTTFDAISFVEAVSGYSMWDCFGFSSVARAHCWLCEETMFHMKIENVSCSSEECASDIMYFINNTHGSCGPVKLKRRMQRWAASHLVSFAASGGSNCLLRTTLDELCILLILLHILDGAP